MNAPETLDPFDPALEAALAKLNPVPPRDPQVVARGRAAFLARAEAACVDQDASARTKRRLLRLALVGVGVLAFGSAIATLAAQTSQPSDALYPVKLWSEEARLALAFSERTQLDLLIEFSNRRLDELQTTAADEATSRHAFLRLERQMDRAAVIAARISNMDARGTQSLSQLQDRTERTRRVIRQPERTPILQLAVPALEPSTTPSETPMAPRPTTTTPAPAPTVPTQGAKEMASATPALLQLPPPDPTAVPTEIPTPTQPSPRPKRLNPQAPPLSTLR